MTTMRPFICVTLMLMTMTMTATATGEQEGLYTIQFDLDTDVQSLSFINVTTGELTVLDSNAGSEKHRISQLLYDPVLQEVILIMRCEGRRFDVVTHKYKEPSYVLCGWNRNAVAAFARLTGNKGELYTFRATDREVFSDMEHVHVHDYVLQKDEGNINFRQNETITYVQGGAWNAHENKYYVATMSSFGIPAFLKLDPVKLGYEWVITYFDQSPVEADHYVLKYSDFELDGTTLLGLTNRFISGGTEFQYAQMGVVNATDGTIAKEITRFDSLTIAKSSALDVAGRRFFALFTNSMSVRDDQLVIVDADTGAVKSKYLVDNNTAFMKYVKWQ